MDAHGIGAALQDVFDQAIVFHAFTDYMRDYEVITHSVADPVTKIPPAYDRYLFRMCVAAEVSTSVSAETWRRSLDDRLIDYATGRDLAGFVWGVKWQCLYPGGRVVEGSACAERWATEVGIPFHEVRIETNAHNIDLVFSDLEVSRLDLGYAPFTVADEDQ